MAYDTELADRIRELLAAQPGVDEKRMFGGLMVRVTPEETERLLQRDHVAPMVMAGRETRGWLRVADDGIKTMRKLQSWVRRGTGYAASLPPK